MKHEPFDLASQSPELQALYKKLIAEELANIEDVKRQYKEMIDNADTLGMFGDVLRGMGIPPENEVVRN